MRSGNSRSEGNFSDMDRQFDFGTFGLIMYRLLASLKRSVQFACSLEISAAKPRRYRTRWYSVEEHSNRLSNQTHAARYQNIWEDSIVLNLQ